MSFRTLAFLALSFAIACLSDIDRAEAFNVYVTRGASTASNCAAFGECGSLSSAVLSAEPGDQILCTGPIASGSFTITKSISIDCSANRAKIEGNLYQNNYSAVTINLASAANDPNRTVRIRGLIIDGLQRTSYIAGDGGISIPSGRHFSYGIEIISANQVSIEDSVFANVRNSGIYDHRTGGQTRLYLKDLIVNNNLGPGIVAASQSPAVTVLDNVSLLNNSYGLAVATGNNVVITRSTISGNTTAGVHADGGAQVNLSNSTLSHNTAHVNAYGTVRLKENEIQFSNVAVQGSGARSLGANRFAGNVTLGSAPPLVSGAPADVYD